MCSGQISVILLSIEHMHIRLRLTRNVKFLSTRIDSSFDRSTSTRFPIPPAPGSYSSPRLSRTHFLTRFLNAWGSSRHILAASTLAGLSSFGLLNMLITLRRIVSGVWTGDHRSDADSYPYLSSSGGWRMEMQTSPLG